MAADLARNYTVVVPELRGLGLWSKPQSGFDKKTQAGDVAGVLDALKIARADLVTHDIGNMLYAPPGAMHSGFAQCAAFDQDAIDNRAYLAAGGKLMMPVLAIGGEKSFGTAMAAVIRAAATDVTEGVVPDSGHWIMEGNPAATVAMIRAFLDKGR